MKCSECNLWWQDVETGIWRCHADSNWPAPCEEDDYEEPADIDDDFGFDPYEGCYTYDC